jgi:hypothetical protein
VPSTPVKKNPQDISDPADITDKEIFEHFFMIM